MKKRLEEKQERLDNSREKILREANEEAHKILREAKEVADESIRNFQKYGKVNADNKTMEKERTKLRNKMNEVEKNMAMKPKTPANTKAPKKLRIGDSVKVLSMNLKGTVHTLPDAKGNLFVQMGILRSQVNLRDLERIDEPVITAPSFNRTGSGKIKMSKSASVGIELNLLGKHNFENVMAACAMSISFGVPMDKIVEVLKVFKAVEHRIEYVTEKRGVRFYNDSKGTNPDAAIQGIRAMNRPTLLIGGGYDKQSEYDEWIEAFDGKVKELVLIGQTADKIEECAHRHGFMNTVKKDTFEDAVNYCYEHAVSGDAVLLSPACASWGMFPNYEERGRIFKEIVKGFKE